MSVKIPTISGIHHVTSITADAQKNVDFYCTVLGLRLVKLTVNFDDPGSYHLYYGDASGRPGTIVTFFAWQGASRGRTGPPQVTGTALAVPAASVDFWVDRLKAHGVIVHVAAERFGSRVIDFNDPDGMRLEIVGLPALNGIPWKTGPVPSAHAIHGFDGVTISVEGYERTAKLLTDVMGFKFVGTENNRYRYQAAGATGIGSVVDLVCVPGARNGTLGAGIVHHVAFRTPDDSEQARWRSTLADLGFNVSPVMDRNYFHSIYFREPGGVLFEIATDNPGFTSDQTADELGTKLVLPSWLEKHRIEIVRAAPPLKLPDWRQQDAD